MSTTPVETMHIRGFDSRKPVCGAKGTVRTDDDWNRADADPRLKRCKRCDRKLGAGGIKRLRDAREKLARLRAAEAAGKDDAAAGRTSGIAAYPADSLERESYSRGYETVKQPKAPAEETGIRTTTPGYAAFLATLEAAAARAGDYSDAERNIITRAIARANRSMANHRTACGRSSGTVTERHGLHGPVKRRFTATCTLADGHAGCHEDENERTAIGRPFSWGNPFRRAGAPD